MKSISKKLLAGVLVASSMITLFITCFRLYEDYRRERSSVDQKFKILFQINEEALRSSLWNLDFEQIEAQLSGIYAFPSVDRVELSIPSNKKRELFALGQIDARYISETFEIYRDNEVLGRISFFSNHSRIIHLLWDHLLLTIAIQFFKTLVSSLLILNFINYILTKRVISITSQLGNNNLDAPIVLSSKPRLLAENDEIDLLLEELNNLRFYFSKRKESLEAEVKLRTKELMQQTEIAIKANRDKNLFLASMSHEFRTPISGIIGFGEILLEEEHLDEESRKSIKIMKVCAENLLVLVNDILIYSSLTEGKLKLNCEMFNPVEIFNGSLQILSQQASSKGLTFRHKFMDLPDSLVADKTRISQVIYNLVGNAIKFTEKGKVSVSFQWLDSKDTEGTLVLEVEDTGLGISPETIARIFEQYSRASSSVDQNVEGNGLGLSISKQLCELMGGEILVTSQVGKGSIFIARMSLKTTKI